MTMYDAMQLARDLIENDNDIVYDVAFTYGCQVENVQHMRWFVEAVANELINSVDLFTHLREE